MAKHVVFLIHGMTNLKSAKEWKASYDELLPELYGRYDCSSYLPFDEQFELKPIFYNDEFDALRKQWAKAAADVLPLMKPGNYGGAALTQLTEWAEGADKDEVLKTHVLDVLLYRFFPNVAAAVRASVHEQMLAGIKGAKRWSVVAHSLGTSVMHDTLVWMFDPAAPKGRLPADGFRLETLAMVANVSRVLESSGYVDEAGKPLASRWDVYRSVVSPGAKPSQGVCASFLNAWHTWDPIPLPKQFKPLPDWPDAPTRATDGAFLDIEIGDIEDLSKPLDVHDIGHYLRNPSVHIPLFRSLIPIGPGGRGLISADEEKKAVNAHREKTPLAKARKWTERLKGFRLSDEQDDWEKILAMMFDFLADRERS
jgi:hypothetical protein